MPNQWQPYPGMEADKGKGKGGGGDGKGPPVVPEPTAAGLLLTGMCLAIYAIVAARHSRMALSRSRDQLSH